MAEYPLSPRWSYPLTRMLIFNTRIVTGENGTEQRWQLNTGEERWTLSYPSLTLAQRDVLLSFFESQFGSAKQDITFLFGGTEYTGCYLDADTFSAVESKRGRYNVSITVVQPVRPSDAGVLPIDFPVLSTGARMQLPYRHERRFDTVAVRTEGGRFTHSRQSVAQRSWSVGGSVLTASEAQAIWDMFRLARGRWAEFQFIDPDSGAQYNRCRFDSDTLEWRYISKSQHSVESTVVQVL